MTRLTPAQLTAIRGSAQGRIRDTQFADGDESKGELETVTAGIAATFNGSLATAPLKSLVRASQKVADDYEGDWFDLKDLARVTIIVPQFQQCALAMAAIRQQFTPSKGRGVAREKTIAPESDPCGYSGSTAFVRLTNGRVAEVQVNVPEVIYAKSSESVVKKVLGHGKYYQIRNKYQLEGGLGHALYEIYRIKKESPDGKAAAALSKKYYDYFRSGVPGLAQRRTIEREMDYFRTKVPRLFLPH